MANSLIAFKNIIDNPLATVNPAKISSNRINNVGDALEGFLKDLYAGTLNKSLSDDKKDKIYNKFFSWLGNSAHSPDFMVKGGEAVEVKKIKQPNKDLALNSSHPKNFLYCDDTRVAPGAKIAEKWTKKDIVYAIGTIPGNDLKRLWLIYGDCYAASKEYYERVVGPISLASRAVYEELGFDLEIPTNEIAKFKKIDPMGITNLRVRGMWNIENPSKLYADFVNTSPQRQYYLLMRETKYQEFDEELKAYFDQLSINGYSNKRVEIRDPDNPAQLVKARFISYEI